MRRQRRRRVIGSTHGGLAALNLKDAHSGQPKYELLRTHLAEQVASGRLKPGESLLPEVEMATVLGVARSTVRQAMAALERDGLVRRVHGKGTFVHEQARQRPQRGLDLFALVVPETQTGFYPALQRSFENAAARTHNQMLVCCTDNSVDRQADIILQLLDKQVGGVALVPVMVPPTPVHHVRLLQRSGIPVVFCHRRVEGVSAPLLAIPYEEVGRRAGEVLVRHGHRRVALFTWQRSAAALAYETGLRQVLESASGTLPETWVHRRTGDRLDFADAEPSLLQALEAVFAGPTRPTAIFATSDPLAELIYLLLERLDYRVPQDLSLVSFGGTVRHEALRRRLTAVTIDEVRVGQQAAELLDRMRRGELPLETEETRVMPLGLVDGQTLGPASQAV